MFGELVHDEIVEKEDGKFVRRATYEAPITKLMIEQAKEDVVKGLEKLNDDLAVFDSLAKEK